MPVNPMVVKVAMNLAQAQAGSEQLKKLVQDTGVSIQKMGVDGSAGMAALAAGTARTEASVHVLTQRTRDFLDASRAGDQGVSTLKQSLSQFDGVLASVGINLGAPIRGLGELGDAAGKTAGEVGGLATAGLVFGAAVAGWKIGRLISEFFGLDVAIGNATAKLLGWGDMAAEEAGAKADVLALASERAGRSITSITEAMKINTEFSEQHTVATADAAAAQGTLAAQAELAQVAIEINNRARLKQAADEVRAHGEMAAASRQRAEQAVVDAAVVNEPARTLIEILDDQIAAMGASTRSARDMGASYVTAFKAAEDAAAELLAAQVELRMEERRRQLESRQLPTSFDVTSQNFGQTMEGLITSFGMNQSGAGSPYNMSEAFALARMGYSFQEILAIFHRRASGGTGPNPPPQGPRIPGFAGGVENAHGGLAMVGERGPEIMYVPPGANIYPSGSGGTGGGSVTQYIYITHPLTPAQVAGMVDDATMQSMRAIGTRF